MPFRANGTRQSRAGGEGRQVNCSGRTDYFRDQLRLRALEGHRHAVFVQSNNPTQRRRVTTPLSDGKTRRSVARAAAAAG